MAKKKKKPQSTPTPKSTPLDEETAARIKAELESERAVLEAGKEALKKERADFEPVRKQLREERKELDALRRENTATAESLGKQARDLEGEHAALADRTRAIIERESVADAGFARRNDAAVMALEERLEGISAAVQEAEGRLAARRLEGHAAMDEEIGVERAARLRALDAEIRRRRDDLESDLSSAAEVAAGRLQSARTTHSEQLGRERAELARSVESLDQGREGLAGRELEIQGREQAAALQRRLLDASEALFEQTVARRVEDAGRDAEARIRTKEEQLDTGRKERARLERRLEALRDQATQFGDQRPDEVLAELAALRERNDKLQDDLRDAPSADVQERLDLLEAERSGWERSRRDLQRELATLKGRQHQWLQEQGELEHQRDLAEAARRTRDALKAEGDRLDAEVQRLRGLYETPKELEARIGVIEQPWFQDYMTSSEEPQELEWLASIQEACGSVGMVFPDRLLRAFHTSLKCAEWSALTVLGGVSGTGKSEMPRLYSRFGGFAYMPLAVEPNWDGPQSLLGFFNSIDNRFNAKPLLRAMVQSQRDPHEFDHGLEDRMLLVLLDEMNLAHVELYFSDLLSKLEDRRGKAEGESWLDVDLGAGIDPYRLPLGRNVLWTGTMNQDSTTKSLSDKVLDRSNMLVFPRPRSFSRRARVELPPPRALLPRTSWDRWLQAAPDLDEARVAPFKTWLEKVNTHLGVVGRALGHRVWQSVEAYMRQHPNVVAAFDEDDAGTRDRALLRAFEDAVVFKVMPKLRGIETSGMANRECLEPIQGLLADPDLGLRLTEDFQHARTVGQGAFIWSSARYLDDEE